MKTVLFLFYLITTAITEFLYPIGTNGKIFWPKDTNVTVQWDENWPIWGKGPVSREILDLWITTYANNDLTHKPAELTDVSYGGKWDWKVDIPDEFADGRDLVLRFREHHDGDEYFGDLWPYASEAFGIFKVIEPPLSEMPSSPLSEITSPSLSGTPSLSTLSSATKVRAAPSAASNNTTASSGYETPTTPGIPSTETTLQAGDSVSRGTSLDVIAGAVVGSLIGVVAIVGAVCLGSKRGKRRQKIESTTYDSDGTSQQGAPASEPDKPMEMEHRTSDLPEWIVPR